MGNSSAKQSSSSQAATSVQYKFEKELEKINEIVNSMLTEKDTFKNADYNFLSNDVCTSNYLLLESDLKRHLKIELKTMGETLYLIPKKTEDNYKINKSEICQRIANHYMKILYILSLVKYVYNIEKQGELSIHGIIMKNIRTVDDLMEISYCAVKQKDYSRSINDAHRLDFGNLEGLRFFTESFLDKEEAHAYVNILRRVFGKGTKGAIQRAICEYEQSMSNDRLLQSHEFSSTLRDMFQKRFGDKPVCQYTGNNTSNIPKVPQKLVAQDNALLLKDETKQMRFNLMMDVSENNPVLNGRLCSEQHKIVIQTNTEHGKKVLHQYNVLKSNYKQNLSKVEGLLHQVVTKERNGGYVLKDLDKHELDQVVIKVKEVIKTFYIQSILDYHLLLEMSKNTPNINILKRQ